MTAADQLEEMLSIYLAARGAGRAATPEEVCRDHPGLLPDLRRKIAVAEAMDQLANPSDGGERTRTYTPGALPPGFPDRLDRYVVVRVLKSGGMGTILLADDPSLARQVAIKVMRPDLAADRRIRDRFLREARSAAAIRHDHVVPIYHVGDEGGVPYMVMPLLEGKSLEDRLERGPLPPAEVARVGREAAEGLAAAHARGVIHRDVKPANLWLEAPAGRVRVLDFGLARAVGGVDGLTRAGDVLGTLGYIAPEQADGKPVDARADLFSLGCVLYRCATGLPAFDGPTPVAVLRATAEHHPVAPRAVAPAVPAALSELILRLLAKDPTDRPTSAAVVADELAAMVARPAALVGAAPAEGRRPRRTPWWTTAAAAACLLGVGAGVWVAARPPVTDLASGNSIRSAAVPGEPVLHPGDKRPVGADPLRVVALDIFLFEKIGSDEAVARGVLGDAAVIPRVGDQVTVDSRLSRPGYGYLVGLAPDGNVHLLSDDRPARPVDRLRYPAVVRSEVDEVRYGLNDGTGLYVFAAVVSDAPLPPFDEVRARGLPVWSPPKAASGDVYRYDGTVVEALLGGGKWARGERGPGEKALGASAGVVRAGAGLREGAGGRLVVAVGFGVAGR